MGFLELFLIGVGLSMDAFAVAICQGLSMTRIKWGHALTVGLYFGGFQALMPLLGWVLGSQFSGYIQQYDHWVAFILLLLIGGNMIREALSGEEDMSGMENPFCSSTYAFSIKVSGRIINLAFAIKTC